MRGTLAARPAVAPAGTKRASRRLTRALGAGPRRRPPQHRGGPLKRAELSPAQVAYLDFVRALGALMVLLGHSSQYLLPTSPLASGHVQQLGVYIFFFISGF